MAAVLLVCGTGTRAVADVDRCPKIGSTYRPNPEDWNKHYFYRLRIDSFPPADDGTQFEETLAVPDVRPAHEEIAVGVAVDRKLPDRNRIVFDCQSRAPTNRRLLDVVELEKSFRQPVNYVAPSAIVLPGFATRNWLYTQDDVKLGYVSYTGRPVFPDLRSDIIWVRVSCGHR